MSEYIITDNDMYTLMIDGVRPRRLPELVRCRDCAHSRIERHTGDDRRVCWKRETHGEVVPDDGFCHDGKEREDGEG